MGYQDESKKNFSTEDNTAIDAAVQNLRDALAKKLADLTPEQRQKYGSINETNKLLVNKVQDYNVSNPELSSPDVDFEGYNQTYDNRATLESLKKQLESILQGVENAEILGDYENYQDALTDYAYTLYKDKLPNTPGYETKAKDLAQFFTRTKKPTENKETPSTDEPA